MEIFEYWLSSHQYVRQALKCSIHSNEVDKNRKSWNNFQEFHKFNMKYVVFPKIRSFSDFKKFSWHKRSTNRSVFFLLSKERKEKLEGLAVFEQVPLLSPFWYLFISQISWMFSMFSVPLFALQTSQSKHLLGNNRAGISHQHYFLYRRGEINLQMSDLKNFSQSYAPHPQPILFLDGMQNSTVNQSLQIYESGVS